VTANGRRNARTPTLLLIFYFYQLAHLVLLQDRDFLLDVVVSAYQCRALQRAAINAMPLYPTEGLLWDTNQIPTGGSVGQRRRQSEVFCETLCKA
jgi:hypothetical protein